MFLIDSYNQNPELFIFVVALFIGGIGVLMSRDF